MYGDIDQLPQTRYFVDHMRNDVRSFHIYATKRQIHFNGEQEAWYNGPPRHRFPQLQGVEWIHVDTFPREKRCAAGSRVTQLQCHWRAVIVMHLVYPVHTSDNMSLPGAHDLHEYLLESVNDLS